MAVADVDLGVQPGTDQVADAGVVAIGQRGLRWADGAHLGEPGLDAAG
jgi:ribosomal protein L27